MHNTIQLFFTISRKIIWLDFYNTGYEISLNNIKEDIIKYW